MPRRAHAQSLFDSRIDIADRQRRHCDLLLLRAREEEGGNGLGEPDRCEGGESGDR